MDPDKIASMDIEQALQAQQHAADSFAMNTLWNRLPADRQGDRTEHARALRADRAESAAHSWLAATERLHRLEHA